MAHPAQPVRTVADLLADVPALHGPPGESPSATHGLLPEALRYIERTIGPGDRTLETGSGLSTLVFALSLAEHRCIVPNEQEIANIRSSCEERGIALHDVTFHAARSEHLLPQVDLGALDLVLIDGSHSFPQVFIDWFYSASALKLGGSLIVDDVHVWTGKVLRDFLRAEPEWGFERQWRARTALFRKLGPIDPDKLWSDQRYVGRQSRTGIAARGAMAMAMIRDGEYTELVRLTRAFMRR